MPCILKVHVEAARGLPAIDKTSEVADAYVEIRFGGDEVQRTAICRKTLDPVWREDFRFEVSDETVLQDEPLELKVFDFDAITADDSVGSVTLDLNPLLSLDAPNQLAGWFPIYDTIRGTRGELWVQVKLEFFENTNRFKESSGGIHLFSGAGIPAPYTGATLVGLVDEVITEVDPDYHWTDSFRTSRSSNEASQRILHQMSCRLRRQMGRKAVEMGGNAILAYCQWIDIEPYSQTITVRGLGTAAILQQPPGSSSSSSSSDGEVEELCEDGVRMYSKGIELVTLSKMPPGCITATGGVVSAKCVKLLSEESEYGIALTRDRWLNEVRDEIRSHARNLGCNVILGYRENVSIHEDLYLLAAEGTACRVRRQPTARRIIVEEVSSADEQEIPQEEEEETEKQRDILVIDRSFKPRDPRRPRRPNRKPRECSGCHLPKRRSRLAPAESSDSMNWCNICRKAPVAEMLLATIELPTDFETFASPVLVESYVCRPLKRKREGEPAATTVSTNLPFVEYDIYRQLQFKLRYHGCNAIFGLRYQVLANDRLIVAIASGTGVCLAALPAPKALQISRNIAIRDDEDAEIYDFQERVGVDAAMKHEVMEAFYDDRFPDRTDTSSDDGGSSSSSSSSSSSGSGSSSGGSASDDERHSVVQIDDEADEDLLLTLTTTKKDEAILMGNLDTQPPVDESLSPGTSLHPVCHFVCHFRRFAISVEDRHPNSALANHFSSQYEEIVAQVDGILVNPRVHCVKHQLNLVRGVELQINTTATIFGQVTCPVATSKELLRPLDWEDDLSDEAGADSETDTNEQARRRRPWEMDPTSPSLVFSTGSLIPNSVFSTNCGTLTLQLFKEIYYHECNHGFSGFVATTMGDLFAVTRAAAAALGGNAVIGVEFKPAAFYENFKSQLHAVVMLTADVINVDFDRTEAWTLLQSMQ